MKYILSRPEAVLCLLWYKVVTEGNYQEGDYRAHDFH